MGFLEREADRLRSALESAPGERFNQLYAAQQAVAWASDPDGFKSPFLLIMGTQEGLGDCSARSRPPEFSDNRDPCD